MPRLHSERSRPYPGRPVQSAIQLRLESAMQHAWSQAGVSRGHSSSPPADEDRTQRREMIRHARSVR
jgi:RNA-directed DNA polymerase